MKITHNKPLFAWDCLEDYPELRTIRDFLQAVPDAKLLNALRSWRGHGRNDCPVVTAWGVLLLTIALRHPHIEATLGELRRNRDLGRLIGIRELSDVPKAWNISRFLRVLGQEPRPSRPPDARNTRTSRERSSRCGPRSPRGCFRAMTAGPTWCTTRPGRSIAMTRFRTHR